jgi:hypothetical protein
MCSMVRTILLQNDEQRNRSFETSRIRFSILEPAALYDAVHGTHTAASCIPQPSIDQMRARTMSEGNAKRHTSPLAISPLAIEAAAMALRQHDASLLSHRSAKPRPWSQLPDSLQTNYRAAAEAAIRAAIQTSGETPS